MPDYDAVVVGSGPNGLASALTLARFGLSVIFFEAQNSLGGGTRSAELTLPGFLHDICSAIYPFSVSSPFFVGLKLAADELARVYSPAALAHPFDDGSAAVVEKSLENTAARLGDDRNAYVRLFRPFVENFPILTGDLLAPLHIPSHPLILARFGYYATRSACGLARKIFEGVHARSLFAGVGAHSMMPLDKSPTAAFGLVLQAAAHADGWPLIKGGSVNIARTIEKRLRSHGVEIVTSRPIGSLGELPSAKAVLFDVTPRQLLKIVGDKFPERYRKRLERYRYGPGVFKMDWALGGPIPFKAPECSQAATIHIGGTIDEIAASEREVCDGKASLRPFVILAQQSLFDPSRVPPGKQSAWAYCHLPHGSDVDMTERIEAQVERFAPGFKDLILARHVMRPADLEKYNANYIGGDINGGILDWGQLFARPVLRLNPYSTPLRGIFICSSSTPPGGGVHGMCGYNAARSVLKEIFKIELGK